MRISQIKLEHLLHKQHVLNSLKAELDRDLDNQITHGVKLVKDWLEEDTWESKEARKDAIRYLDLRALVLKIVANIVLACLKNPMPLVSLASMTNLSDDLTKLQSIQTAAELIAVLEETKLFAINKIGSGGYSVTTLTLPSEELERQIEVGCYLPPLIEKPKTVSKNTDSALHTITKDSLILGGKMNEHTGRISLDVINRLNQNEYTLETESIKVEKPLHTEELNEKELAGLDILKRIQYELGVSNHNTSREQFDYLKNLLVGRTIHFTHKFDMRGRVYSQGHHFNPMGSSYEKSCIELANKQVVTGEL